MYPDSHSLDKHLDEFAVQAAISESHALRPSLPRIADDEMDAANLEPYGKALWDQLYEWLTEGRGSATPDGYERVEWERAQSHAQRAGAKKRWDELEAAIKKWGSDFDANDAGSSKDVITERTEELRAVQEARFYYHTLRAMAIGLFLSLVDDGMVGSWTELRTVAPAHRGSEEGSAHGKGRSEPSGGTFTVGQKGYFHTLLNLADELGLGDDVEAWGEHFNLGSRGMDLFGAIAARYTSDIDPTTPRSSFERAEAWYPRTPLRDGLPLLLEKAYEATGRRAGGQD